MSYNFKTIQVIPGAKDLIDIILSKTQRKTPTVVHPQYSIGRLRKFYMRKIKFTQQNIHEKMSAILEEFPKINEIHPFYSDLMNVLYNRDHFKLALGHLNTAKGLIDNVAKEYVRLMKYADSLYRCKMLKRAALGRMATIIKKMNASLVFLEEVRKHLARLPTINPHTRTLIVTGYPNVGKSSFMNIVTNADVEVQPYAFTTKSLYVGHTDHNYVRWQVIDTPGILDHPLEHRNTIEMQAITALAHLNACVLYFVDLSETCGYTLEAQVQLFENIKPLFHNKPLIIVANKTDAKPFEAIDVDMQQRLRSLAEDNHGVLMTMSNKALEGVMDVKTKACDILLAHRLAMKSQGDRVDNIANRLFIANPKPRDDKNRDANIPQTFSSGVTFDAMNRKSAKDLQEERGGAGVFFVPAREHYDLEVPEWKNDVVPEIMDGMNVADYVDPDIEAKLLEMEKEEEMLEGMHEEKRNELNQIMEDNAELLESRERVFNRKHMKQVEQRMHRNTRVHPHNPTLGEVNETLGGMGVDTSKVQERFKGVRRNRGRSLEKQVDGMDIDNDGVVDKSRGRSKSKSRIPEVIELNKQTKRMVSKIQKKWKGKQAESDRHIGTKMPKHLFSGKRGIGDADRR